MTLVVARKSPDSIHIVSDTKLSFEDQHRAKHIEEDATLKCIVLSPTLCVAFANDSSKARTAIAPLLASNHLEHGEVRQHLLDCHRNSHRRVDFVLATSTGAGGIDLIREGTIAGGRETGWIGDKTAFEEYQRFSLQPIDDRLAQFRVMASTMSAALEAVIANPSFPSVGGFALHASSSISPDHPGKGFHYTTRIFGSGFQPVANTTEPTSLLRSVGSPGGSYNYAVLAPGARGVGAVAIYVLESRMGALFYPRRKWSPMIYRGLSCSEFVGTVKQECDLLLTGIQFS